MTRLDKVVSTVFGAAVGMLFILSHVSVEGALRLIIAASALLLPVAFVCYLLLTEPRGDLDD